VVIIDDEEIAREALSVFLENDGIEVAAVAADGVSGLRAVREFRPDVALVDLGLPNLSGAEVTTRIHAVAPEVRVLVVTGSDREADVIEAIRAGATGYLLKSSTASEVTRAIRVLAAGGAALSDRVASRLMKVVREGSGTNGSAQNRCACLSAREVEILVRIAAGKDNANIAADLYLSPHTVKNHVAHILGKLKLENRTQAAAEAVRAGLV
jgi:DNA-binding NarL/FixJ family response regulator